MPQIGAPSATEPAVSAPHPGRTHPPSVGKPPADDKLLDHRCREGPDTHAHPGPPSKRFPGVSGVAGISTDKDPRTVGLKRARSRRPGAALAGSARNLQILSKHLQQLGAGLDLLFSVHQRKCTDLIPKTRTDLSSHQHTPVPRGRSPQPLPSQPIAESTQRILSGPRPNPSRNATNDSYRRSGRYIGERTSSSSRIRLSCSNFAPLKFDTVTRPVLMNSHQHPTNLTRCGWWLPTRVWLS